MMSSTFPALTVVVPSVNGWSDLSGCLAALALEHTSVPLEVIVVERCGGTVGAQVNASFPFVRVVPVTPSTTIPQMRALAFGIASADTVSVIEDHVIVPAGWARQMLDARTGAVRVVGGTVYNAATTSPVDRAAFLCEYSHVMAGQGAGVATWLVGNNTAYERLLLQQFSHVVAAGRWENVLHDAFRASGVTLWHHPEIVAAHKKHYSVSEYTSQRFLYARAFGADRVSTRNVISRIAYGAAALALPPILFVRIVRQVLRTVTSRAQLIESVPLLLLFVTAWGLGEVTGAWFGDGGAMAKVK